MSATRADVVAEALKWEGTPYHHRARVMGYGVDCAQLPAAVYHAVGLVPELNPEYTSQWMMHRDEEKFLEVIEKHAVRVPMARVGPGDLIVYKFGRTFSHSVIVIDKPQVLHAAIEAECVCRADIQRDSMFWGRPRRCYTLWPNEAVT